MSTNQQDSWLGKTINGFEITGVIGHGGMATVYRATQISMSRTVAMKVLPRQYVDDETYMQRFTREVSIVSKLEHRCIVPVYDYGEHERQPYIAMRYMPDGSIDSLLVNGAVPLDKVTDIIRQIAPALDYAHSKNVLHRDLKPSNILLDDGGGAYITDFGIARILGEAAGSTITTQGVVGTPAYMSPEQAQGFPLDSRSDLYSLGVMLFEMLTGRRPFESETPYGVAVMQVTTPPPQPRSINPNLPSGVEQVIFRAMHKKADARYQTAADLAAALQDAIDGKLSDTQPRPLFRKMPNVPTQPVPESPPPQQVVMPNTFTPPPYSAPANQPPSHAGESAWMPPVQQQPSRRKRRRSRPFVNLMIGGMIGCALLALLVAGLAVALSNLNEIFDEQPIIVTELVVGTVAPTAATGGGNSTQVATNTPEPTSDVRIIPSNTPNVPAAAVTVVTQTPNPTATEGILPPGIRETSYDPDANPAGEVVYFTETDGNYDLFRLSVGSGAVRRMTYGVRNDQFPAVSYDGRQVVFTAVVNERPDLHVMGIDGDVTRITDNGAADVQPAWSPDSAWIVFASDVRGDGRHDLFKIRPDGSNLQLLLSNGQRNSTPHWLGQYIVFTTGEPFDARTWELALFDPDSGEVTQLTDNDVKDWGASWSPDGERLLFHTQGEGGAAIAVMDMVGTDGVDILYDSDGYDWGASWSPDGDFIVFSSDESGRDQLYLMRFNGEDVTPLTENGGFPAAWIPS